MTTEIEEERPKRGMTDEEKDLAERFYSAIQRHAIEGDRGRQSADFRIGVSDLGYCSERTRRMLMHEAPPDEPDMLLAWIGTAIGDAAEEAVVLCQDLFPGAIKQAETVTTLVGDRRTYEVLGHPDLVLPVEGILIDNKTSFGLQLARRMGADQQKNFQRHCYAAGAWDAGLFPHHDLRDIRVGNVWIDRSGMSKEVHVQLEPFDDAVLFQAAHWLEEVIDAYRAGREAEKEPPREVCETTCGFFKTCRAFDTDVTGLLEGPETLAAVQLYLDGKVAASFGDKAKKEAKAALAGISGSTGRHTVRWVDVNPTETRAGYARLDIREIN